LRPGLAHHKGLHIRRSGDGRLDAACPGDDIPLQRIGLVRIGADVGRPIADRQRGRDQLVIGQGAVPAGHHIGGFAPAHDEPAPFQFGDECPLSHHKHTRARRGLRGQVGGCGHRRGEDSILGHVHAHAQQALAELRGRERRVVGDEQIAQLSLLHKANQIRGAREGGFPAIQHAIHVHQQVANLSQIDAHFRSVPARNHSTADYITPGAARRLRSRAAFGPGPTAARTTRPLFRRRLLGYHKISSGLQGRPSSEVPLCL